MHITRPSIKKTRIKDTIPRAGDRKLLGPRAGGTRLPGPSASGGGTVTESPTALIFTELRIFPNTATTRGSEEPGRQTTQGSQGSKPYK